MVEHYVVDSAHVFNQAVGARGNDTTRASDHLPVIATFVFNDQIWPTQRASVYNGADPVRPKWKSRLKCE